MGAEEFEQLKNTLVAKFESEYQSERIGQVAEVQVAVENMNL